jgi:hypothetical protein
MIRDTRVSRFILIKLCFNGLKYSPWLCVLPREVRPFGSMAMASCLRLETRQSSRHGLLNRRFVVQGGYTQPLRTRSRSPAWGASVREGGTGSGRVEESWSDAGLQPRPVTPNASFQANRDVVGEQGSQRFAGPATSTPSNAHLGPATPPTQIPIGPYLGRPGQPLLITRARRVMYQPPPFDSLHRDRSTSPEPAAAPMVETVLSNGRWQLTPVNQLGRQPLRARFIQPSTAAPAVRPNSPIHDHHSADNHTASLSSSSSDKFDPDMEFDPNLMEENQAPVSRRSHHD